MYDCMVKVADGSRTVWGLALPTAGALSLSPPVVIGHTHSYGLCATLLWVGT